MGEMQYAENPSEKAGVEEAGEYGFRAFASVGHRHFVAVTNSTPVSYPNQCVHELFEEQAARTPDAIAVSFEEKRLKYRELDDMANAVARYLRELGVGPEAIVAICMERSVAMVAGLLGILKSGGACLPLDPSYPAERLAFMLQDSRSTVLLTESKFEAKFSTRGVHVLAYDGETIRRNAGMAAPPVSKTGIVQPANLVYVLYTSGSTGKPKGVLMPHGALVNLLRWNLAELPGARRTLQFAPLSFDVSFQEIFSTWSAGGNLVLITDHLRRDPEALWNFIVGEKIERLFLPFVALQQLTAAAGTAQAPDLREIITAGEQLNITPKITGFFEKNRACALHNHYGPTESHVVTAFSLRGAPRDWPGLPPIGKPITNAGIHILDDKLRPVAAGEAGEIHIAGSCLARGYLNRPDINAQKFIQHYGTRLYKTGDIGRFLPGGDIEFLARRDDQVKIRGHRVELAEIEAVILRHSAVSQCAVVATPDAASGRRLLAYVVLWPGSIATCSDELVEFLKKKLPDYMIPFTFALLDSLPLTPTGKVDRRALPAPGDDRFCTMRRMEAGETSLPPATGVEAELIRIWEEALEVHPIGIHENFFDMGGDSLLAVTVSREVAKSLGKRISIATIFRAPTVEELAVALNGEGGDENAPLEKIRAGGSRTPFFCMPALFDLAHWLGPDQPCYGLNFPEFGDKPDDWPKVEEIAASCIQIIRAVQPQGPYCLGGYSFGGVVVFEIARQLEASGEDISLLAMLEPDPPKPFRTTGLSFYLSRIVYHARRIARLSLRNQVDYLVSRLRKKRSRFFLSLWNIGDFDPEHAVFLHHTGTVHARFHALRFGGKAILFLAQDTVWRLRPEKDPRLDWKKLVAGEIEICETPGDHTTVIREPNVRVLAQRLSLCLEKAWMQQTIQPNANLDNADPGS